MAVHSALSEKTSPVVARKPLAIERVCQAIVLLIGARCTFVARRLPVGADSVAYLDLARAYVRHDWHTAVNGYWGPLYAWLLAITMRIFHPGILPEIAVAQALNFALLVVALYTFSRFWHEVAAWSLRISDDEKTIPEAVPSLWIVVGYLLLVVNFTWNMAMINPDVLVAAIVFAIGALLFRLDHRLPDRGTDHIGVGAYVWLGLLLAVGYYAKTIMLYFAVFVLGAITIQGFRSGSSRKPIAAVLVFAALISPFVLILSRSEGHFTAGDSGRLNYSWFVDGPETKTWMKEEPGSPIPFYPGPILLDSPRVFGLPSIAGVTYAPWYDATRFDTRTHPRFDWRGQLRELAINLRYPKEQLMGAGAALIVPMLLLAWYTARASLRHFTASWFCTLPAAAIFGMYLLVHLVQRFVLGFSLVLWAAAWASICVLPGMQLLARRAMLVGIVVFSAYTLPGLLHFVIAPTSESTDHDVAIAESLSHYGINAGDAVASIGNGQEAYWAYLARVPVVAEVWSIDSARFWAAPSERQQVALRSMANSGAKAVVWRRDSDQMCPAQWQALPENSGCIATLR
jgi:hypothetical protein